MKMTMHIDDALLERVMRANGLTSKTAAIDFALRESDRRAELKRLAELGLGLSAAELREAYDPSTPADKPNMPTEPVTYVNKPRSRR